MEGQLPGSSSTSDASKTKAFSAVSSWVRSTPGAIPFLYSVSGRLPNSRSPPRTHRYTRTSAALGHGHSSYEKMLMKQVMKENALLQMTLSTRNNEIATLKRRMETFIQEKGRPKSENMTKDKRVMFLEKAAERESAVIFRPKSDDQVDPVGSKHMKLIFHTTKMKKPLKRITSGGLTKAVKWKPALQSRPCFHYSPKDIISNAPGLIPGRSEKTQTISGAEGEVSFHDSSSLTDQIYALKKDVSKIESNFQHEIRIIQDRLNNKGKIAEVASERSKEAPSEIKHPESDQSLLLTVKPEGHSDPKRHNAGSDETERSTT